jgi:hypothetical protein
MKLPLIVQALTLPRVPVVLQLYARNATIVKA